MAGLPTTTASGRGRPAELEKHDIQLPGGGRAIMKLLAGGRIALELPPGWALEGYQGSATRTSGRTQVRFAKEPPVTLALCD